MRFEFATAARVVFGPGAAAELTPAAQALGRRALVAVNSLERAGGLIGDLRKAGIEPFPFLVDDEPTLAMVTEAARLINRERCDLVIGLGGGSALDTAKAAAAMATNPGEIEDYLEVIGRGKPLTRPSLPVIAVPTTAGTGSEVTRNAVLTSPSHRLKVSLRGPGLLPRLAIVDPELTYSLPAEITASTGLDALTQLIEPFVSNAANPLTDALCRDGMRRAARSLQKAFENGGDKAARQDMCLASLCGGLALANARLGAVHGLATPIGATCHAPHGAVCARLLPAVMEANLRALHSRQPTSPVLERYAEIARLLTGEETAAESDGVAWTRRLVEALSIPPLSHYGLKPADFAEIIRQGQMASSMKGNPLTLSDAELIEILEKDR